MRVPLFTCHKFHYLLSNLDETTFLALPENLVLQVVATDHVSIVSLQTHKEPGGTLISGM